MNKLKPQGAGDRAQLAVSVLDARVHRTVTVPRTSVRGDMRLLSRRENAEVRLESRMAIDKFATGVAVDGFREFHEELAVRTLAVAVRDPSDRSQQLASLSDWCECDDDQISALWETYQDLEAELDPLGANASQLDEGEVAEIVSAAKKKDVPLLTSYGSRKLARCLVTTVDQLQSSQTPKS